jgi:drug/metabolite transporter (DMT)-like permease
LKERLRIWGWLGLLISLGGVVLLSMREGAGIEFDPGAFAIVVAALAASISIVAQKPWLKKYSAVEFVSYTIWFGTLLMLPFAREMYSNISTAPVNTTLAVVYMGIFPAALGYLCWTYILSKLSASVAVSFLYLVPFLATFVARLSIKEELGKLAFIGGSLVLLGVIVVQMWGKPRAILSLNPE